MPCFGELLICTCSFYDKRNSWHLLKYKRLQIAATNLSANNFKVRLCSLISSN